MVCNILLYGEGIVFDFPFLDHTMLKTHALHLVLCDWAVVLLTWQLSLKDFQVAWGSGGRSTLSVDLVDLGYSLCIILVKYI